MTLIIVYFLLFYCPASQPCSCKWEHQLGYKTTDSFEDSSLCLTTYVSHFEQI